ncbi:MAG: ATP-binding cassette domain-containing protein [Tannerellaceae bacterium]|jgi:ATPase subunit of ABC transporter with duplicated ATPase domains|nr:ATP-binding cassette domain-containing protein [Tannerellaceae bacterium]
MSIIVQDVSYSHPDKELLFKDIRFTVGKNQKVALTGNNGSGKSTLLRIIAGNLPPASGEVICSSPPYYVPQHFGQYNRLTVAEALGIDRKLSALRAILEGDVSAENFATLDEDWNVEEKSFGALALWGLEHVSLSQPGDTLSGGEKTKVFLAGIQIYEPDIVLMDEPTNHLDVWSRKKLYSFIESARQTLLIVSHDITLLDTLPFIYELSENEVKAYGGNYGFYKEQKELQAEAVQASLDEKEKELRQAKKLAREVAERRQKDTARGKKQAVKKGLPRIVMNQLASKAGNTTSKLKEVHAGKMDSLKEEIKQIQNSIPDNQLMKLNLNASSLHAGKTVLTAKEINFNYGEHAVWQRPLSFQIKSGDRLSIKGRNGSGKTTLLKMIAGEIEPSTGEIARAGFRYVYIDQEYAVIENALTVTEQIEKYNLPHLQGHELRTLLNRFLFPHTAWNKKCACLSGGEKMRLLLCCLLVGEDTPDMILLDEPANNLDIQSSAIITSVIRNYRGTVLAVSHDPHFLQEINVDKSIDLTP